MFLQVLLTGMLLVTAWPTAALDCPPLEITDALQDEQLEHARGLLWKVQGDDAAPSYLFGTVHISDPRVTDLPAPVYETLVHTDIFAMEALLDGPDVVEFARNMFYSDERRLSEQLPPDYYREATRILAIYGIPPTTVDTIKPWAAFLTMNMPPDTGVPLDLVLMGIARERGAQIYGLESLDEQVAVFERLGEEQQLQMLKDSICHYDILQADIEDMVQLYLQRDIAALFRYREKYRMQSADLYQQFLQGILWDRNKLMVERMQSYLQEGNAFIAIGAMHLPGELGILRLLEREGYRVESVY